MGARLQHSAWKIMTFIDVAVNLHFVFAVMWSLLICGEGAQWFSSSGLDELCLGQKWSPTDGESGYRVFLVPSEDYGLLEIVYATLTRGPGSNTDSWPLLCFVACPNIWNLPPLQKSIPQSYKSLGNKPGSRIHWEPSSLCGVWRGWRGQRRWVQLGAEWVNTWIRTNTKQIEKKLRATFPAFLVSLEFLGVHICATGVYFLVKYVVLLVLSCSILCFPYMSQGTTSPSEWPCVNDS